MADDSARQHSRCRGEHVRHCPHIGCSTRPDNAHFPQRSGQTILIPGGAGRVGHFAVQLAKAYGLRVITSASKPDGLDLLRKLRADVVIDYSKQDVVAEVMAATGGAGADEVYDTVCALSSFQQSAAVVRSGDQWMFLGQPFTPQRTHTGNVQRARRYSTPTPVAALLSLRMKN